MLPCAAAVAVNHKFQIRLNAVVAVAVADGVNHKFQIKSKCCCVQLLLLLL